MLLNDQAQAIAHDVAGATSIAICFAAEFLDRANADAKSAQELSPSTLRYSPERGSSRSSGSAQTRVLSSSWSGLSPAPADARRW